MSEHEREMNIYTCSCKAYKLRIKELEAALGKAVDTILLIQEGVRTLAAGEDVPAEFLDRKVGEALAEAKRVMVK